MDGIFAKLGANKSDAEGGFIADDSERLSYAELGERIDELIETWSGQDWVASASVVALPMTNDIAGITAFFALLRRGLSIALLPTSEVGSPPPFCGSEFNPTTMMMASNPTLSRRATSARPACVYVRTSGSTGTPKWVVFSEERLCDNAEGVRDRMAIGQSDCVLVSTPLAHMFGLGAGLLSALLAGASVRVTKSGDPLSILKAERESDPTVAFLIPSQCRALLPLRRSPRQYRVIIVGVGRLSQDFAAAFEALNGTVAGMYGSTELGAAVGAHPDTDPERRRQYIGPPMKSVRVFVEPDQLDGMGRSIGPIYIEHGAGFLGYADMSGEIVDPAPDRLPMGDLGTVNEYGDLDVIGRVDGRIKRDGLWVLISDIEACLFASEGVAEAAVISAGETRRGARIIAYVVAQPGATIEAARLLQVCREKLPRHMVPDEVHSLKSFKRLASGKIDLRALLDYAKGRCQGNEGEVELRK